MKLTPRPAQLATELADPPLAQIKLPGNVIGLLACSQCSGDLPVTRRHAGEPVAEVDARRSRLCRAGTAILYENLLPLARCFAALVELLYNDVFLPLAVFARYVADVQLGA